MVGSICLLFGTIFDLLNPKFIHFPNFLLKGQKLSKFVTIRCQIDPIIPNYQLY